MRVFRNSICAEFCDQQFSLTASPGELKDPFSVGVTQGTGVIEGAEFRNFLRDKLIRTFVKKGVRFNATRVNYSNSRIILIIYVSMLILQEILVFTCTRSVTSALVSAFTKCDSLERSSVRHKSLKFRGRYILYHVCLRHPSRSTKHDDI